MSNPLDTKIISKLAEILDKSNLTELEYEDEGCRICLTRDFSAHGHPMAMTMPNQQMMMQTPVAAPVSMEESATVTAEDYSKNPGCVKSPMVGVVYLSSDPNTPNYVKVGDNITEGDTLCLIEAMKTYNPVKAPHSGKITKIFVESGDPVEYGEPLVIIE